MREPLRNRIDHLLKKPDLLSDDLGDPKDEVRALEWKLKKAKSQMKGLKSQLLNQLVA